MLLEKQLFANIFDNFKYIVSYIHISIILTKIFTKYFLLVIISN